MSNTPRPKSLALMFLLGAFLTGGAVGYAADRAVTRAKPVKPMDWRASRDSLALELNLTAAQRKVIDSVFDWRRASNKEIMDRYRPLLDSVRDSARVLMLRELDAEQQKKFHNLIERNKVTADSIAKAREGAK